MTIYSKTMVTLFFSTAGLFIGLNPASAGFFDKLFGYDNYDDCILSELDGSESQAAASLIKRSCRSKFPREIVAPKKEKRTRLGYLTILDSEWRSEFDAYGKYVTLFAINFKNNLNADADMVVVYGQKRSVSCERSDAVHLGGKKIKVAKRAAAVIKINALDKLNDKDICFWVEAGKITFE